MRRWYGAPWRLGKWLGEPMGDAGLLLVFVLVMMFVWVILDATNPHPREDEPDPQEYPLTPR